MLDNVLITLDGSKHAEEILHYVAFFTGAAGAKEVTLLRVCDGPDDAPGAEAYLRQTMAVVQQILESGASPATVRAAAVSRDGRGITEVILSYATSQGMDVIMAATHGWTGSDWWAVGDVADSMLRGATIPILLLRPAFGRNPRRPQRLERLLTPLDGSPLAEAALPYAQHLGRAARAEVFLFHSRSTHEPDSPELTAYLESMAADLVGKGTNASPVLRRGSPPGLEIVLEMEEREINFVVMSSHGETGATEGAFGGVASAVLHGSHAPVLIVPCR